MAALKKKKKVVVEWGGGGYSHDDQSGVVIRRLHTPRSDDAVDFRHAYFRNLTVHQVLTFDASTVAVSLFIK